MTPTPRLLTRLLLASVVFSAPGVRLSLAANAAAPALTGDWVTPDHSAVEVFPCGSDLCLRVARLPPHSPSSVDGLNPNPSLRTRPLCGLEIGSGFHRSGEDRAEGGSIYDPKSGRTYHGSMTAEGDMLHLRGYVGFRLFGRTETWTRSREPVPACAKNG